MTHYHGDQFDLFPPPLHREPTDTEVEAVEKITPTVGRLRRQVLALAIRAGTRGITGEEASAALDMADREYSIRPRLTELCDMALGAPLVRSGLRRPNKRGNNEVVYMIRRAQS